MSVRDFEDCMTLYKRMHSRLRTCPANGYSELYVTTEPPGVTIYIIEIDWSGEVPKARTRTTFVPHNPPFLDRTVDNVSLCHECGCVWPQLLAEGMNYGLNYQMCKANRARKTVRCAGCRPDAGNPHAKPLTCVCFPAQNCGRSNVIQNWVDPFESGLLPGRDAWNGVWV